jgi:hypothetical protein
MKPILEEITKRENETEYNEEIVNEEEIKKEERQGNVVLKIEE